MPVTYTRRHLRLPSTPGTFPSVVEKQKLRDDLAQILGLSTQGILMSSYGFCPIPIPPPGAPNGDARLPATLNLDFAWLPMFWLPREVRLRREFETDDHWHLRLLLSCANADLLVTDQAADEVIFFDTFDKLGIEVDQERLRIYRDGHNGVDSDLRRLVIDPGDLGEIEAVVDDLDNTFSTALENEIAQGIERAEQAAFAAIQFFTDFDKSSILPSRDLVETEQYVERVIPEMEEHLVSLKTWEIMQGNQLEANPALTEDVLASMSISNSLRAEHRHAMMDEVYRSRGDKEAIQALFAVYMGQMQTITEEAQVIIESFTTLQETEVANPTHLDHRRPSSSQGECVHAHYRHLWPKPFPEAPSDLT